MVLQKKTFGIIKWNSSLDSSSISSRRRCVQQIKKSYHPVFWEYGPIVAKTDQIYIFGPFGPFKMTLRVIQLNPCFGSPSAPSLGSFMTFKIDLYDNSTKSTFLQYIRTFLIKLHAKEENKLSNSFWEIHILSEKLTTDDDGRRRTTTDDGQLGIRKATLPFGCPS